MCADTSAPAAEAPDYRDTVFLPETTFPMRAGLPQREPDWLARWARLGIYDRLRAEAGGRVPFILHDGPPYANGHLHIGHALNKVLKDFITRSQQMMGRDARYVPGWDCHGLPIEWKIEEQYRARGQDKDAVDTVEFRQECRAFAAHWVDVQRGEFERLGVIGNWADPYLTMDFHAESVIAGEFQKLVMNGSLYQGSKPVMWSPVEKTALAEAEVEYHDVTSHQVWVRFPVTPKVVSSYWNGTTTDYTFELPEILQDASVVIWTTTPWTIPQNRAVAFSPNVSYGVYRIVEVEDGSQVSVGEKLILADGLADGVMRQARVTSYELLGKVASAREEMGTRRYGDYLAVLDEAKGRVESDGQYLGTLTLAHPYRGLPDGNGEWDFDVPLLPGDHVTDDAGTGFVHTAPSHGEDDYQLGLKFGLPMTFNVEPDGSYRADLPVFGGQAILTPDGKEGPANVSNIKALAAQGALLAKGKLKHSYPHSWRSKAPLIYRNTPQWFAAIDKPLTDGMGEYGDTIRSRALTSIDELVTWTPRTGRNRIHSMVENRPDWVLSRQRAWGVPLAAFTRRGARPDADNFLLQDERVNARILEAFEAGGADVWYTPGFKEQVLDGLHDPADWDQVMDVLDVWFDSGSTHAFVLRDRADGAADGIADLYLEGTDQHRGWFQSSLLQASATLGRAPYRGVLTHGFTLDAKGMKMSKSLGNTVAPADVVAQYGADILRLWVAQADYTADQRIGPEILKGTADSYRRLRNAFRFMLGALEGFSDAERLPKAEMPGLERWVLHRLAELDGEVREGFASYDFQGVFRALFDFATSDLSAFWFDIRKDALYCDAPDSLRRRAVRTVLDAVFQRLTLWLAPILPFTAEDVWLSRFPSEDDSVHLHDFPDTPADWLDPALAGEWDAVRRARRVVTAALEVKRADKTIGASLEAAPDVFVQDDALRATLGGVEFADVCITSALALHAGAALPEAFRLAEVPGVAVGFALAEGQKCQRCWKILPDVGSHDHPGTCARCDAVLTGMGA